MNTPNHPEPLLLRVNEAAALLGVARATCYGLISSGRLPVVRLSDRSVRINRKALERLIDAETVGAGSNA